MLLMERRAKAREREKKGKEGERELSRSLSLSSCAAKHAIGQFAAEAKRSASKQSSGLALSKSFATFACSDGRPNCVCLWPQKVGLSRAAPREFKNTLSSRPNKFVQSLAIERTELQSNENSL